MSFKESLLDALKCAVHNFNEGATPDASVVKAAEKFDYNAEQTQRLVESFNTARTLYHFKTASDRTARIQLADRDTVLGALFAPVAEKAAAVPIDISYGFYDSRPQRQPVEKAAESTPASPFDGMTVENITRMAEEAYVVQCQEAKHAEDTARILSEVVTQNLDKLAEMCNSGYEDEAQLRFAKLKIAFDDPKCAPVMQKLAEFVRPHILPSDAQLRAVGKVVDTSDLADFEQRIEKAAEALEQEIVLSSTASQLRKEADEQLREFYAVMAPFFKVAKDPGFSVSSGPDKPKADKPKADKPMGGSPVSKALDDVWGGMGGKGMMDKLIEAGTMASDAESAAANADMSERLKNVQRQLLLQDLMATDPVLSEADPQAVAQAYQAVVSMAPDVSMQKEIMRAILRQSVHSLAVGPYDAQVWTDLEKNIRAVSGKGPKPVAEPKKGR